MRFTLETHEIVEVVRPITSGVTQPYLCLLSDDRLYAVKGRGALRTGLIAEVVSGWLGKRLGIPIPDFGLAKVPRMMSDHHLDGDFDHSIGRGTVFASLWREPFDMITMPALPNLNVEILAKIYVFDHWIKNGDRTLSDHGGNPNLMIDLDSGDLIAIDHNLAFLEKYQPSELEFHACRSAWKRQSQDLFFVDRLKYAMSDIGRDIEEIIDMLPYEWVEEADDFLASILDSLERASAENFWAELS